MKIEISSLNDPYEWHITEVSSTDIQELVKFADKWWGKVKIEEEQEVYVVIAKNESVADAFDTQFRSYLQKP